MIARATTVTYTTAALGYAADIKKGGQEIDRNDVFSDDRKDIAAEFRRTQQLNSRAKQNTVLFMLSPTAADGARLTRPEKAKLVRAFLKEMDIGDRQWIAYQHGNTKNKHIHIIANRIDYRGKALDSGFISLRAKKMANKVAADLGLTTVAQVQHNKREKARSARLSVLNTIQTAIATSEGIQDRESLCIHFSKEKKEENGNLWLNPHTDKYGKYRGMAIHQDDEKHKASDVDRSLSLKSMDDTIAEALEVQRFLQLYEDFRVLHSLATAQGRKKEAEVRAGYRAWLREATYATLKERFDKYHDKVVRTRKQTLSDLDRGRAAEQKALKKPPPQQQDMKL